MRCKNLPLILILLLATALRFYQLNHAPPSPSLDEVSIGYNAYSILKTTKDEFGNQFPLILRAYDDWRPAFYVYLVIPFVWILGLTTLAVRMPSVIMSVITVYLTYLLTMELFREHKNSKTYASISSLLMAISPWHIYASRLGHEVNLGLTLTVSAMYFFIKAKNQNFSKLYLSLASAAFALSLNSYQSEKVVTPVLILFLAIIYWRDIIKNLKNFILPAVIFALIAIPLVKISITETALTRLKATTAFDINANPLYGISLNQLILAKNKGDMLGQIVNNRRVVSIRIFLQNYLVHFSPRWLFTGTGFEAHKVPYLGLLYWWEFPIIVLGLYALWQIKIDRRIKLLLIVWFLSAPVSAAITTQAPHALRSYTFLPVWQIFGALGLVYLLHLFNKKYQKFISLFFILILIASVVYFGRQYYFIFPATQSESFQYALVNALNDLDASKFNKVIINNSDNLYQSYMFYLFLHKVDPLGYQKSGGTGSGGYNQTHRIGNLEFRPIIFVADATNKNSLLIGNPGDFLPGTDVYKTYKYLDGRMGIEEFITK